MSVKRSTLRFQIKNIVTIIIQIILHIVSYPLLYVIIKRIGKIIT